MVNVPYQKWLDKARQDLKWTQANLKEAIWYGACFTAQQAAEKILKAYLSKMGKEPPRIHSLVALLEECIKFDENFAELREQCSGLTVYYAPTRYIDLSEEFVSFSEDQAREAYKFAQEILEFVGRKL